MCIWMCSAWLKLCRASSFASQTTQHGHAQELPSSCMSKCVVTNAAGAKSIQDLMGALKQPATRFRQVMGPQSQRTLPPPNVTGKQYNPNLPSPPSTPLPASCFSCLYELDSAELFAVLANMYVHMQHMYTCLFYVHLDSCLPACLYHDKSVKSQRWHQSEVSYELQSPSSHFCCEHLQ